MISRPRSDDVANDEFRDVPVGWSVGPVSQARRTAAARMVELFHQTFHHQRETTQRHAAPEDSKLLILRGFAASWRTPEQLGKLVAFVANSNETATALQLARELLALASDAPESTPRAKFSDWEYQQILTKDFPALVPVARMDALSLLCELLAAALSQENDDPPRDDLSWIWRPAIEDHVQNAGQGEPTHSLVAAIRDAATDLLMLGVPAADLLADLATRKGLIFRRIATHILAANVANAPDLARSWVLSQDLATTFGIRSTNRVRDSRPSGGVEARGYARCSVALR